MRRMSLLWGVFLAAQAAPAVAVEVELLGPTRLERAAGCAPRVFHLRFVALADQPGTVRIWNGTADGEHRVTSAVVRLNHRVVVPPRAFGKDVYQLERAKVFAARNVLEISLRGKPGSHLTVSVTQDVAAHGAAVVGPAGGSVEVIDPSSEIRGARLEVPAGALAGPALIRMNPAPDAPSFSDGAPGFSAVELQPSGLEFAVPARLTLPYQPEWLDPDSSIGEESLSVYTYDEEGGAWASLATDPVDAVGKTVSTPTVFHFSRFALKDDRILSGCSEDSRDLPEHLPVLLVHGFQLVGTPVQWKLFCGYGAGPTFGALPELLGDDPAADVFVYLYNSGRSIPRTAQFLAKAITKVRQCYREDPEAVTLIAHSEGGLVARAAIEGAPHEEDLPVSSLTTLDSPHLGAPLADLVAAFDARLQLHIQLTCPSISQMAVCSAFLEGADSCLTAEGGLNGATRSNPNKPLSPDPGYHLFADADDWIVPTASALGTFAGLDVFEPPAFAASERSKTIVPAGCSDDGSGGCGHLQIANVTSRDHAMWPFLRDIVKAAVPGRFEMLLLGGTGAKVLDGNGRLRTTLDIPTGAGAAHAVLSTDGERLLYTVGVNPPGRVEVRLHDFDLGSTTAVTQRDWAQTIQWVPGSDTAFVYNTPGGSLQRYDLSTGSDTVWQANDTVGGRVYRGGLYWDASASKALFQAGYGGAGGDGVYLGEACATEDPSANHHVCGIVPVDLPGGGSSSWAAIAATPRLSSDGLFGYYVRRFNWTDHQFVRARLEAPFDTTVLHSFDDPYGSVAALHGDRYLLGWAASAASPGATGLWKCDVKKLSPCTEVYTAASPGDVGPVVTAKTFPRPH